MRKTFVVICALASVVSAIFSVTWSTQNYLQGLTFKSDKEKLFELNNEYEELKANHLKLVLDHLEPEARAAGFVSVNDPRFLKPETTVGFFKVQ